MLKTSQIREKYYSYSNKANIVEHSSGYYSN